MSMRDDQDMQDFANAVLNMGAANLNATEDSKEEILGAINRGHSMPAIIAGVATFVVACSIAVVLLKAFPAFIVAKGHEELVAAVWFVVLVVATLIAALAGVFVSDMVDKNKAKGKRGDDKDEKKK